MAAPLAGDPSIPSPHEFERGYRAFQAHERRDAMYKTASFLVDHYWGKPRHIADSLGVLLLTWNQAFYRFGLFSFDQLERCLRRNGRTLARFRERNILEFADTDVKPIGRLFGDFNVALAHAEGARKGVRSPVATAKALHLMAPAFFPLWDGKIARAYRCYYMRARSPADEYIRFILKIRPFADGVPRNGRNGRTALKLIDEYNYAKYTKHWI